LALILLLLGSFLDVNVWSLIWPLFLIALGLWTLWGVLAGPRSCRPAPARSI
jgi:hypothetical protein